MYPTLTDFFQDVFGIYIPLPIQSFGFFVAMAFLTAFILVSKELKRKENEGMLTPVKRKVLKGKPASIAELVITGIIAFFLGFKLGGIFLNYTAFNENPQDFIFSTEGSIIGGLILAGIAVYLRWKEKDKEKAKKPYWEEYVLEPNQLAGNLVLVAAVGAIIGAKIFHNLENLDEFAADPIGSLLSFSGLTFYGGLILATIMTVWYGKKNGIPPLHLMDLAAPVIMIGYGIGRIGCQVAGDGDWGIVNLSPKPSWLQWLPDGLWSYNYPHNVLNQGIPIPGCTGKHCFMLEHGVFPTPVYETLMCVVLFAVLWFLRKRFKTPGILFSLFLLLMGIERMLIEQIRVNNKYHIFGYGITQAELISGALIIIGIAGIIYFYKQSALKTNQQKQ